MDGFSITSAPWVRVRSRGPYLYGDELLLLVPLLRGRGLRGRRRLDGAHVRVGVGADGGVAFPGHLGGEVVLDARCRMGRSSFGLLL